MAYEIAETCMLVDMGLLYSECASWVQAWGSIAAIGAGMFGIWWQMRKQAAAAKAAESERIATLAGALFQCRCQLVMLVSAASKSSLSFRHIATVRRYLRGFDGIELHQGLAPSVQIIFASMMASADVLEEVLTAVDTAKPVQSNPDFCIAAAENLIHWLDMTERAFEDYLVDRGTHSPSQSFYYEGINYHPAGRGQTPK